MKQVIYSLGLVLGLFLFWGSAHAENKTIVDDGTTTAYFKVDGKKTTPEGAVAGWHANRLIEQCKPKKGNFEDDSGKSRAAFQCKKVVRHINTKNGNETWKNE
jgi:hypothetical protein